MLNKFRLTCALLISAPSFAFATETLIFALDVIRHGDRTPVVPLSSIDYHWQEGPGQLTAEGIQQEYTLGTEFRTRYIKQTHLLPEHYQPGTMYIRSTDYDRTLMSAQSLLMGLYPPGTGPRTSDNNVPALPYAIQPIPVFSAPSKYDEMILQRISYEERIQLLQRYVYSTQEWQQKNKELKKYYPRWSRLTGVTINGLEDLELVGDTLYVHQVHNAPMPDGLSALDIETIIEAGHWVLAVREKSKPIANVFNAKMMTHIANFLEQGSQHTSKLKYVLLSAHDTTVAGALSYLEAPLDKSPPYAANLNFSLYENGNNEYSVKVSYNNTPVSIPACGGTVCELQQFIQLVKNAGDV